MIRSIVSHSLAGLVGGTAMFMFDRHVSKLGRFERLIYNSVIQVPNTTVEILEQQTVENDDDDKESKTLWHSLGSVNLTDGSLILEPLTAVPKKSSGPRTHVLEPESFSEPDSDLDDGWCRTEGIQLVLWNKESEPKRAILVRMFDKPASSSSKQIIAER